MPPTSKAKPSRKATKPKPAVIKRTLPEYATALEKEKALIPDTKRCKSQRDAKKNVDKAIYDNFRSLSNYQIHIEIRDGFTLFDRLTLYKDLVDQNCVTTGKIIIVSFANSILATWSPSCLVTKQIRKTFSCETC